MDEGSLVIGAVVGALVLLSPFALYWTVALFDTIGLDRYLPDVAFMTLSALIPVLIVCSVSFLVMRYFNRPREWIREKLTLVAAFLFVALFVLLSMMGAV